MFIATPSTERIYQSLRMHFPYSLLALLSPLLLHITQCLPAPRQLPNHLIYSLPPRDSITPLNGSSSNGNCASPVKFPSWSSSDWVIEDCYTAVQQLYVREVLAHPNTEREFLALGVRPTKFPLEQQRTPRKYIVRRFISGI